MPETTVAYTDMLGDTYPGPYVDVRLSWQGTVRNMKGLVDSGADQSIVPHRTALAMKLTQIDEVDVEDANGNSQPRPVYAADLELCGHVIAALPMAGTDYPIVLIGRDVLCDFVAVLNGPRKELLLKKD